MGGDILRFCSKNVTQPQLHLLKSGVYLAWSTLQNLYRYSYVGRGVEKPYLIATRLFQLYHQHRPQLYGQKRASVGTAKIIQGGAVPTPTEFLLLSPVLAYIFADVCLVVHI